MKSSDSNELFKLSTSTAEERDCAGEPPVAAPSVAATPARYFPPPTGFTDIELGTPLPSRMTGDSSRTSICHRISLFCPHLGALYTDDNGAIRVSALLEQQGLSSSRAQYRLTPLLQLPRQAVVQRLLRPRDRFGHPHCRRNALDPDEVRDGHANRRDAASRLPVLSTLPPVVSGVESHPSSCLPPPYVSPELALLLICHCHSLYSKSLSSKKGLIKSG